MAGNASAAAEVDNFGWTTDDELEIDNFTFASPMPPQGEGPGEAAGSSGTKLVDNLIGMGFRPNLVLAAIEENGDENEELILQTLLQQSKCATGSSSDSKVVNYFLGMGFSEDMVHKAIKENGESNTDAILESILTYRAIEKISGEQADVSEKMPCEQIEVPEEPPLAPQELPLASQEPPLAPPELVVKEELDDDFDDNLFPELEDNIFEDLSDFSWSEAEEASTPLSDEEKKIPVTDEEKTMYSLVSMGFLEEDVVIAMERCGPDATIEQLTDFISAAQMARLDDPLYVEEEKPKSQCSSNKRKLYHAMIQNKKKNKLLSGEDEPIRLPNPMIGFGLPTEEPLRIHRTLTKAATGPPYFYFENVALAPKGVWDTISRFLYDVEPEFVDSKYFCAAARKRGYVHNLPTENRFPILPLPPATIHDALPMTRRWWPKWDPRTKLNCLQTCIASAKLTERIRKAVERYNGDPPVSVQKFVLDHCRKWNLVWVGTNKVAPLEPDEVEMLLGFPRNHTRGGGISRTDRYKSLGNSFQVDTVAYHLSVLKDMYPQGINVFSMFTGIGGGEVALHRQGVRLNNVVSVEISEANQNIVSSWWEQTNQQGNLIHINDVQEVQADKIEQLISAFGGFDLIIGGSPCNNLTGSNRHHRDGLEGKESGLFYDFFRILDLIKCTQQKFRR